MGCCRWEKKQAGRREAKSASAEDKAGEGLRANLRLKNSRRGEVRVQAELYFTVFNDRNMRPAIVAWRCLCNADIGMGWHRGKWGGGISGS